VRPNPQYKCTILFGWFLTRAFRAAPLKILVHRGLQFRDALVFSFAAEQKLIHHYDDAKSLEQQQLFKHHLGVVVEGAQQLFMVSVFFYHF
jgi:hypothetical protein